MAFARATATGDGEDQGDIGRVDLLTRWNADGPGEVPLTQRLTEVCAQAVAGIGYLTSAAYAA